MDFNQINFILKLGSSSRQPLKYYLSCLSFYQDSLYSLLTHMQHWVSLKSQLWCRHIHLHMFEDQLILDMHMFLLVSGTEIWMFLLLIVLSSCLVWSHVAFSHNSCLIFRWYGLNYWLVNIEVSHILINVHCLLVMYISCYRQFVTFTRHNTVYLIGTVSQSKCKHWIRNHWNVVIISVPY